MVGVSLIGSPKAQAVRLYQSLRPKGWEAGCSCIYGRGYECMLGVLTDVLFSMLGGEISAT
jgi:hypothetical protein